MHLPFPFYHLKPPLPQSSKVHIPFSHYHLKPFMPKSYRMHIPFPFCHLKLLLPQSSKMHLPFPLCHRKPTLPQSFKVHPPFPLYHSKPFLPKSSYMHLPFPFYDPEPPYQSPLECALFFFFTTLSFHCHLVSRHSRLISPNCIGIFFPSCFYFLNLKPITTNKHYFFLYLYLFSYVSHTDITMCGSLNF
jgi:hypothetical protein